jgi:rhomboid family GlyGly-CTERM serine protease
MSRSGEGWFVRAGRVWATLTIASLATVVLGSETLSAWFIYDRDLLKQGQWWRSWTGHLVHFGRSHLFWDLVVLLPAGCWLESTWPKFTRWFYLGCPLTISAILYVFEPALLRYGGLSGLATGVLVLLAGLQLRLGAFRPTSLWWGVLGLVGFKIGNEMIVGAPLLVSDLSGSVRSVPLAHLGGAACGILGCVGVCLTPSRIVGPK